MKTALGVDENGVVRMIGSAPMPTEWNGLAITTVLLDDKLAADYAALSSDRSGTTFDGATFTELPAAAVQPAKDAADAIIDNPAALAKLKEALK